jgi:hypothetical protein
MDSFTRGKFLLALCCLSVFRLTAQDESEADYEFISGTIADLPSGKIVVNRAVVGKPPEFRTFTITDQTKIEGQLSLNARVTVGYKASDESEPVAMRIIVRPQAPKR